MKKIIYWAFLIILLSACGSTSSQNITAQKNESLAVFCLGDLKDSAMMRLALDRYQEVYPDIKVCDRTGYLRKRDTAGQAGETMENQRRGAGNG